MRKKRESEAEADDRPVKKLKEAEVDSELPSTSSWAQPIPILSAELTSTEVPVVDFHALVVADLRSIGKILKKLKEIPEEFRHLKRIKDGRILICPTNDEELLAFTKEVLKETEFAWELATVQVAARKPLTVNQFNWVKQRWPTAFHPNKEIEGLVTGTFFTQPQLELLNKTLDSALPDGCVIADGDRILAHARHGQLALEHAAIEAVRDLARRRKETPADDGSYLATGCDVFLANEPCAMCAMALLHARAKRIFYRHRSANGVLGSGPWKLHEEPILNHHYQVFHVRHAEELNDVETSLLPCGQSSN